MTAVNDDIPPAIHGLGAAGMLARAHGVSSPRGPRGGSGLPNAYGDAWAAWT